MALALLERAVQPQSPFSLRLFDGWYLTEELVLAARRHQKDRISLLKTNRNLESYSLILKDAQGQPVALPPSPTKGNLPTQTIGEACRQQAQAFIQALMLHVHDQLQQGLPATDVLAHLCAKQGVALAT